MNKTQRVFEISSRPTEPAPAEPQPGVRTDTKLHIQAMVELINALLAQVNLLQNEPNRGDAVSNLNLRQEVRRFEVNLIKGALTRSHGSQVKAARYLGLKATTLNAKMKRYRLHRPYLIRFAQLNQQGSD